MRSVTDPTTGKARDFYVLDGASFDAPERSFVQLSRELADMRGGLRGAGTVDGVAAAMAKIKLSERAVADRAAAVAGAGT